MSKTRAQKQVNLTQLTDELTKAKAVVFADYKGMSMSQLSDLRNKLYDQQAKFTITKNTLLRIALKDAGKPAIDDVLQGPVATLFAYDDEISPLKILVKTFKDNNIGKIKAGILGSELMDEYKVIKLSTLPSKDDLRSKLVGTLVAPISGLQSVLFGNIRNLVYALSAIQKSRGGE